MTVSDFFNYYYQSPPGDGPFGPRHLIFMCVLLLAAVAFYRYAKKHKQTARIIVVVLSVLMFTARLVRQVHRVVSGIENPPAVALPWHLCSVMILLMPVIVVLNLKKLKQWVYPLCLIGGIVTLVSGTYFEYANFTVFDVEGITAHTLLVLIPIAELAAGEYKLELSNAWKTAVGLAAVTMWGLFADLILFPQYHTNSSQLMENEMGVSIPGIPFQVLYALLAFLFIAAMHGIPQLVRMVERKKLARVEGVGVNR